MDIKKIVEVTSLITVQVNEDAFTPAFMEEFRASFYDFKTLDEHIEHLGQLYARGIVHQHDNFIEGYGDVSEFGIKFITSSTETEIV